jgi:chloramphenicol-sensitive protein RarD
MVPLYFRAIQGVPPREILAHRIVWSLLFLGALVAWFRRWPQLKRCLVDQVPGFLLTSVLIALNWYFFIEAVDRNEVRQASLGYYITPLVSVVLGLTILGERLRRVQIVAVLLAATGVLYLTLQQGDVPWLALIMAGAFGLYGLIRKRLGADGLVGLTAETVFLVPVAIGYLAYLNTDGSLVFGQDRAVDLLLLASGVVTAVPLMCFGQAAQKLPLSSLGFLQYLSPTIQLLLAIFVFGEAIPSWTGMMLIWIALMVFTIDSVRQYRRA